MPARLADLLENRQEFLDLTKFLSVLGRPGDFANDESPVIRKWLVAEGADTPPAENATWFPAYAKVDDSLPPKDLGTEIVIFAKGYLNLQVGRKSEATTECDQRPPTLARRSENHRPNCPPRTHPRTPSTHLSQESQKSLE